MKTIKLLLLLTVLTFSFAASCEKEEIQNETQCDCTKTYYLYYPAMGSGGSYIPARYEVVDVQVGNYNCSEETTGYVPVSNSQYSHYKIICN